SLMTSVALNDCAPYREVITHGFVVDKDGKKISKSAEYKKPTHAEHFVNQYGADILRLWVATVNYTDEVPFGEDVFKQVAERYRGFRNIQRILLANLFDFAPANASLDGATAIDRWVLSRLREVTAKCRAAYEAYEFRAVFEALNQFCTVDLSALYIDITKDRLYCDAIDSPRRRATQTVMHACFDSITRLLAPILVFTAEEAWDYFKPGSSIHLEQFPEVNAELDNEEVRQTGKRWLEWRGRISQAVEQAQKNGEIANPLEARVRVRVKDAAEAELLQSRVAELEEFWILSHLEIVPGDEDSVEVAKTSQVKCERCWRHRPDVGANAEHPTLCGRCAEAVLSRVLTAAS
ncbi:MAG TPA: class I tRNA ligase family protein, partial [Chthoniobacterales bacterium]